MSGQAHDPALLEHVARKAAFAFAMPNALPEWLEVLALGRDMMPLGEIVAPAVLDALIELGWQPPTTLVAFGLDNGERVEFLRNQSCPKCGGDPLRTDFTGSGRCHVGEVDVVTEAERRGTVERGEEAL